MQLILSRLIGRIGDFFNFYSLFSSFELLFVMFFKKCLLRKVKLYFWESLSIIEVDLE